MPQCFHCKQESPAEHYLRIVENKFGIHWEEWAGWRFSGRFLIAPGKGERVTAARLSGLLWEEAHRQKIKPPTKPYQIVRLPARERFDGSA